MSRTEGIWRTANRLEVSAALGFAILVATPARADFTSFDGAFSFAVLGQFSNNTTNFNNGTINGDVGIGSPRNFTISNATLNGNIRFSGAANTSGVVLSGPNQNVFGSVIANDPTVTTALNNVNSLSQTLG